MGHILIADDHQFLLKALSLLLQKEGYTLETAENGQQAIDMFSTSQFDLVITDIDMPLKNGLEVIDFIRGSHAANLPIIVLSSMINDDVYSEPISNSGASYLLSKTDSPLEILRTVKSALTRVA